MGVCPVQSCYCVGWMSIRFCDQGGRVAVQSVYARGCVPEVDVVAQSSWAGGCVAEVVPWLRSRDGRVVVRSKWFCGCLVELSEWLCG